MEQLVVQPEVGLSMIVPVKLMTSTICDAGHPVPDSLSSATTSVPARAVPAVPPG